MRRYQAGWFWLVTLLAGCAQEVNPATAIVVSIQTDLQRNTELSAVEYRAFRMDANPQVDAPVARFRASADQLGRSYVLEKNEENEVLLAVQGFGPSSELIVEYRARARFEAGKTIELPVFLARACRAKACSDPGQTCHGSSLFSGKAGECGPIPSPPDLTDVASADALNKWDAGTTCTIAPDAGICDAVTQCGCPSGQACRTDYDVPVCAAIPANPLPLHEMCDSTLDCQAGLACGFGYCAKNCRDAADCGPGGACYKSGAIHGVCLKTCAVTSDCVPGVECLDVEPVSGVPKGKYCAKSDPAYLCSGDKTGNGVCDEPVVGGTGRCKRGEDTNNCSCDVVSQKFCAHTETCRPKVDGDKWYPTCYPAGGVAAGGACSDRANCARGMTCVSGACTPYCDFARRTGCTAGKTCTQLLIDDSPIETIGICD